VLSEPEALRLLYELCVRLGFCLPSREELRLKQNPPSDAKAFTDAVLIAEGLDPATAPRHLYRQVRDTVAAAY
jgi:hypothetical protein